MHSILVTGGAGFVGARVVRRLAAQGRTVSMLVRPKTNLTRVKDLLPKIRIVTGDLADRAALQAIFKDVQPAGVLHLAASVIMSDARAPADEMVKSNFLGTVDLLDLAAEARCGFFVQAGTSFEYGIATHPFAEDDHCRPVELYGITKLAATRYGQAIALTKELPVVTLRLFTPYGPGIQEGRLIERIIKNALAGAPLALTDPKVTRDFVFVDDIAELFLEAAEKAAAHKGEVFNVGSGKTTTLKELITLVQMLTKTQSEVRWGAAGASPYDRGYWCADMKKTFAAFSWRPRVDLTTGLAQTIEWMKQSA